MITEYRNYPHDVYRDLQSYYLPGIVYNDAGVFCVRFIIHASGLTNATWLSALAHSDFMER